VISTCPTCALAVQHDSEHVILSCKPQLTPYTKVGQTTGIVGYVHTSGKRNADGKLDEYVLLPMVRVT
jgi:hypothetical protein